ncbi:Uracil DNA glycosylase superfamily protein [Sphingomonas palmae]|uniref:Uracil DNA glycosylase superfamily protein n=1 Tax=Sphingomonas palmae TaxID=1855283 RepID=A0A1H7LH63_9SPHN|nr:uracil-DNA glycosylase [Sphingomonas palmae]SEK98273.1 Uracil DNA glycosylase superfamily protein [Sphingomonas palmae]
MRDADRLESVAQKRLEAWRRSLVDSGRRIPLLDPADGGAGARLLILLETPGPGDDGDRMVSRDNPTGTARNLTRFLHEAAIARRDTILWNTVPWIVHEPGARNRPLRRGEIREGLTALPDFLALLPHLRVAVLAGRVAREAAPVLADCCPHAAVLTMPHPSPTIVCTSPEIARMIRNTLAQAAALLGAARS